MADTDKKNRAQAVVDENWRRTQVGISMFFDTVAPWLLELGIWIFGALTAFNLLVLGVELTIGPTDDAVKIATLAFALALPPNVAGLVLVRLVTDMRKIRAPDVGTQAFVDAGFQLEGAPDRKEAERRVSRVTLTYTFSFMAVAILLTLTGLTAALWHTAWWVGVSFLVMLALSIGALLLAASQMGGRERWRSPGRAAGAAEPEKPAES